MDLNDVQWAEVIQLPVSLAEKLANLDVRILQTGLVIVVLFALLNPMGLSVPLTDAARAGFQTINSLPPGSMVVFACGTNPGSAAEHAAMGRAMMKHLVRNKIRIAFLPSGAAATTYVVEYANICRQLGYKEGVDFLTLPFRAGEEKLYASIGSGFKSVYSELPTSPLWDSIKSIKSAATWIDISGGSSPTWAMAHIGDPHGIPVVAGVNSNMVVTLEQYVSSGQLSGVFGGLAGGAQYEVLSGLLGEGVAGMDAQGLGYLWIIVLMLVGNIGYVVTKKAKASKGGASGD